MKFLMYLNYLMFLFHCKIRNKDALGRTIKKLFCYKIKKSDAKFIGFSILFILKYADEYFSLLKVGFCSLLMCYFQNSQYELRTIFPDKTQANCYTSI